MENILTMRWSNDFIRHLPYNETWMLYDLCRPVARVKRPDCSYHTGLNYPTFMSISIRRSLEQVMIYTTSPPYSRTRYMGDDDGVRLVCLHGRHFNERKPISITC